MQKTQGLASSDFTRLQEEHTKAIHASKEKIEKWETFKSDYEALQARLYTLPDELTHDVMVPFGKFAFMPGKLYHTNEVLVLLGDNWFVKTSAKHALEIIERRKQYVAEMLSKEHKQFEDWESRYLFTEQFQSTVEEHKDTVEIKEEYVPGPSGKEKVRKAWTPKGNVPPPRRVYLPQRKRPGETESKPPTSGSGTEEAMSGDKERGQPGENRELWTRLDELSLQEVEHAELVSGVVTESGTLCSEEQPDIASSGRVVMLDRTQTDVDVHTGSVEAGSLSPPVTSGLSATTPLRIAISHGEALSAEPSVKESEETADQRPLYSSPADIFSRFIRPEDDQEEQQTVTMAKQVKWGPNQYSDDAEGVVKERSEGAIERSHDPHPSKSRESPNSAGRSKTPFTGQVVERSSPKSSSTSDSAPKRVSRFKAERHKK